MAENFLYYGDNLDVLRRHVADESIDLVYLDPPFNSNASYNVLFASQDGTHQQRRSKRLKTRGAGTKQRHTTTSRRLRLVVTSRRSCRRSGPSSARTMCWPIFR
jgi:16S rRNA G966 N2-methylase RsmD